MTRARDLSKLANGEVFSIDSNNNVGINSLTPDTKLDVVGVVSATSFEGDGSQLTGIIAGATLSESSGTQRLVVTSLTTGSMTEASTTSGITYETETAILSSTKFSGTLLGNSTGLQGTPSITVQDITAETISIAGTISYEDVDNVNSVGIITANKGIRVPDYGITVTGIVTATSLQGDTSEAISGTWTLGADGTNNNYTFTGPGLTGAENDPTLFLQRGMNYHFVNNMGAHQFQIQSTAGQGGTAYGDGVTNNGITNGTLTLKVQMDAPDKLYYQCTAHPNMGGVINIGGGGGDTGPRIIAFNPEALTTGISTTTNITITFDQDIKTAGTGNILIKGGSSSGSTLETLSITNGTPGTGISISGTQLIINPTINLPNDTNIFVILPSDGIQNNSDVAYDGSDTYNFRTTIAEFGASGGDDVFTTIDANSPSGYYRYHVFTTPGTLTTTSPVESSPDLKLLLVAGGGGGASSGGAGGGAGGVVAKTHSDFILNSGTYTITIGDGGSAGQNVGPGTPWTDSGINNTGGSGGDSTITPPASPTTYNLRSYGGGGGRMAGSPFANAPAVDSSGVPGGSGGGTSGLYSPAAATPSVAIGTGTFGQGNDGGAGFGGNSPQPSTPDAFGSGGGGGAGSNGSNGSRSSSTAIGGPGGAGTPHSEFNNTNISNSSVLPAAVINAVGSTGLFGGGGGGGVCYYGDPDGPYNAPPTPQSIGGPGGGGKGDGYPLNPGPNQDGIDFVGGGGGGGSFYRGPSPNSTRYVSGAGDGGKGVMILRYASPSS